MVATASGVAFASRSGRIQDQLGDLLSVCNDREVARVDLDGCGAYSLSQKLLQFWRDGAIDP
jgi:hypothetical protein